MLIQAARLAHAVERIRVLLVRARCLDAVGGRETERSIRACAGDERERGQNDSRHAVRAQDAVTCADLRCATQPLDCRIQRETKRPLEQTSDAGVRTQRYTVTRSAITRRSLARREEVVGDAPLLAVIEREELGAGEEDCRMSLPPADRDAHSRKR